MSAQIEFGNPQFDNDDDPEPLPSGLRVPSLVTRPLSKRIAGLDLGERKRIEHHVEVAMSNRASVYDRAICLLGIHGLCLFEPTGNVGLVGSQEQRLHVPSKFPLRFLGCPTEEQYLLLATGWQELERQIKQTPAD